MNFIDSNYVKILQDEIKQLKNLLAMNWRVENISSNKNLTKLKKIIEKIGVEDAQLCELILKYEAQFSDYQILEENSQTKDQQISQLFEERKQLEEQCNKLKEELEQSVSENIKYKVTLSKTEKELEEQEKIKKELNDLKQLIKKQEIEKDYHKRQNQNYTSLMKQLQNEASENQNAKDQMFAELSKQVKIMKNQLENCQTEYIQKLEKKEQEIKNLERKHLMLQKKLEMSEDFDQILSVTKKSPKECINDLKEANCCESDQDDSVESFHANETQETTKKQTPERVLETQNKINIQKKQGQSSTLLASTKKKKNQIKVKH